MLFGKLLPREGNFFEMFNQHAERIVEAAHAFSNLVANYSDVQKRESFNREVDHAERAADRITHEVNRALQVFSLNYAFESRDSNEAEFDLDRSVVRVGGTLKF